MSRWLVPLILVCSACGPLSPPRPDAGNGGGGGFLFGGGTGGGTGGGFGGGSGGGSGGGGVAGGGSGGGAMGGGSGGGAMGGGGGATGGGGGGALAPLTWAAMTITGATSSSYIIGLSGSANDLYAIQDTGYLFHSTGGAFSLVTSIQFGAKGLYAAGGTIAILQNRSFKTCSSNCTSDAAFTEFDLVGLPNNLTGEAICGREANDITAIVSDTNYMGKVFHWDGTTWTLTDSNLGVKYPRACWFDSAGALNVVGEDQVVRSEQGANTPQILSTTLSIYYGGGEVGGTSWVVGPNHYAASRTGSTWTRHTVSTSSPTTLFAVGGLSENEVYMLGYYHSTAGMGFKWNGTTLTPLGPNALPSTASQSTIRRILVTAPNELYLAGSNTSGPIIIRGRR